MTDLLARPMPIPTPITETFWQGLSEEKVLLQRCRDCQAWVFYPRSNCSNCLSTNLGWQRVSGEGEIYSFTIARRPTAPHFVGMEPQFIAVIELKEGVRMNSVIVNADESELKVGLKVKPVFDASQGDQTLLHFEPA
jgi:uncharacterized OB-fold protein